MIKIVDGKPSGFVQMYWINDYKRFGVMMEEIFNPSSGLHGVLFKKGKLRKSIVLDFSDIPASEVLEINRKKFLEIEAMFGIPLQESKYKGDTE